MVTLTLVEETTFVEGTTESVGVALAAQVSGEFPSLDVSGGAVGVGESVADDTAGFFHGVVARVEVLVVAHVVDEDGQDVRVALDELAGDGVRGVDVRVVWVALSGAEEGVVQPGGGSKGQAALGADGEGRFLAGGREVAAEYHGAGVEAVVGAVEGDGGAEGTGHGVGGGVFVGGLPFGVGVGGREFGEGVDGVPLEGVEIGEIQVRDGHAGTGDPVAEVVGGVGDGLAVEGELGGGFGGADDLEGGGLVEVGLDGEG